MAKAYWVCFYRSISNPAALAEYAKLAGPAIQSGGGRFLVRGVPTKTYESGMNMRTVVTEFDSVQHHECVAIDPKVLCEPSRSFIDRQS